MDTLSILMVGSGMVPIPPPGYGAVEKHIWYLAKALKARGHRVEILNEVKGPKSVGEYRFALSARRRLGAMPHDVLHVHTTGVGFTLRAFGSRDFVYTSHSRHWISRETPTNFLGFALERRIAKAAPLVIALTKSMAHLMARRGPTAVVPNGVDLELYHPGNGPGDGSHVVAVGAVERRSAFHLAAMAMEGMASKLTIYGPWTEPRYAEALADHPNVILKGEVPEEALAQGLRSHDILAHPAASHPFSMAVVEAMASGLPVIASTALSDEVDDGLQGFLIPSQGPETALVGALRQRLQLLVGDSGLRRRMGLEGRRRAEREFAWPRVAEGVEMAYRTYLGIREAGRP